MKKLGLLIILAVICVAAIILAMGIGTVPIVPSHTINVILYELFGRFGFELSPEVEATTLTILADIRIPRALLAFVCGSGLAVGGVIMQSVLRNPLASSYTLGVSSGAAVGATLTILLGITIFGSFTLPFFALFFGVITVFAAIGIASNLDRGLQNNTIILTGMALSLFANAIITIILALSREDLKRMMYWQMGSFALKSESYSIVVFPIVIVSTLAAFLLSRRMDILSLGDEQAQTTGVNAKNLKIALLCIGAVLTGAIVSAAGIVGFIDLFTPHVARKLFGASHRYVIPASVLLGGAFMVICDLLARTVVSPLELPIGAVTAFFGAPFFIYLYFGKRGVSR